jgi:hypothetical protein
MCKSMPEKEKRPEGLSLDALRASLRDSVTPTGV